MIEAPSNSPPLAGPNKSEPVRAEDDSFAALLRLGSKSDPRPNDDGETNAGGATIPANGGLGIADDLANVRFDELHFLRSVEAPVASNKSMMASARAMDADLTKAPPSHARPSLEARDTTSTPPLDILNAAPASGAMFSGAFSIGTKSAVKAPTDPTPSLVASLSNADPNRATANDVRKTAPSQAPARTPSPRTNGGGASSVFLAFNSFEANARITARVAGMSAPERTRLRQGIGALLAAYGIHHASININGEGDSTWPKSRQ